MFTRLSWILVLTFVIASSTMAAKKNKKDKEPGKDQPIMTGTPVEFFEVCYTDGLIKKIGTDGKVKWEHKGNKGIQDVWKLENGNILYSHHHGVREITYPDQKIVWEYNNPEKVEIHTCQPIEDGKVMLIENGPSRLIEVDRACKIVKEIKLDTPQKTHLQFRTARKLKNGNYLVTFIGDSVVKELDPDGVVLKEFRISDNEVKMAHGCARLPDGSTLVSSAYKFGLFKFDADGKKIWEFTEADLPEGVEPGYAAGIQALPNGNVIMAVYHGNPAFLEITPDKKVVWSFYNAAHGNVSNQLRLP